MSDTNTQSTGGLLVLPAAELSNRQSEFQSHYRAANNSPAFYNTLQVPWPAFRDMALEGMDPDQYIIGFIHRYDTATNNWYLAGERFTFNGYSGPGDYPIASTNTLFNILPDGTVGNYDGGLQPYNGHLYDPVYFNSVMSGNIPLDPAIYVNRVTFAWEELKQLHCDNKSHIPGADDNLFSISFCGISADYSAYVPAAALIPFPHCVAMYMSYNGVPLLNDDPIVSGAMFANKAADMDCICPPKCDAYSWPTGLEPKNC
jgi:hypothetical protein